jgi:putative hydrolase of HD superfamily
MSKDKCCGKHKAKHKFCKRCPKVKKLVQKKKIAQKNKSIERLAQQMNFIIEVDRLKTIIRRSRIADGSKFENDAEHSWHLALMAMLLSEHAVAKKMDLLKVIKMVLIHDLVEIDAGDTYAYDVKGHDDKREREEKAAERIFNLLPKDQAKELIDLWEEFEENKTSEAKFASVLDRVQPILLNYTADGLSWKENNVTKQMVIERNAYTKEGSKKIWKYIENLLEDATEKGYLINEEKSID